MIVPVATALPRDDIDSVDAIVILPYREPALRMRRADRGRAHEHGGEPRISCWRHLAVLPLDAIHPNSAIRQALLRARLPELSDLYDGPFAWQEIRVGIVRAHPLIRNRVDQEAGAMAQPAAIDQGDSRRGGADQRLRRQPLGEG